MGSKHAVDLDFVSPGDTNPSPTLFFSLTPPLPSERACADTMRSASNTFLLSLSSAMLASVQDRLVLANGYVNLQTANFDVQLVRDAQTLASLRPAGSS